MDLALQFPFESVNVILLSATWCSLLTSIHLAFFLSCLFLQVFITSGWMSDVVIVVAVTNREARSPAHGISLFLVENGTKGFIKGRKLNKIGLKAQVSSYNL